MRVLNDEIRTRILQVAEKLFCEKGYLETTTRSIAKEVGISVSNLYLYYENKEMIFNAVAEPIFQQFITELSKNMNHEDSQNELNENISFVIGKMVAARQGQFLLIFEKSKGTKYDGFQDKMIELVQNHIISQLNDKITDKALLSSVLDRNLIEGIVTIVKKKREEEHLEQNLKHLTDFYVEGIKQFIK